MIAAPILAANGLGQSMVVVYREGIVTKVTGWSLPLGELVQIAEGAAK